MHAEREEQRPVSAAPHRSVIPSLAGGAVTARGALPSPCLDSGDFGVCQPRSLS